MIHKKSVCALLAMVSVVVLGVNSVHAAWPDRPVHIIVGYPAGGSADIVARLVATKLSAKWGQPVIVENRVGADGIIAEDMVAHSKPDGYMIALLTASHTISAGQSKLSYDPIKDFVAVSELDSHPDVLVVNPKNVPVKSLSEFIAFAQARPGQINYASGGGTSTPTFLETEELKQATKTDLVLIAYQGAGPAVIGLLGGETSVFFASVTTLRPLVVDGKLTALAVSSNQRSPLLPDVPTVAEALNLPDFRGGNWEGFAVSGGTPKDIVDQIAADSQEAIKSPDLQKRFADFGYLTIASSPAEFDAFLKSDIAVWAALSKSVGVGAK